jgi:hypothetical protein
MGYTIFTRPQVTPRQTIVHGPFGTEIVATAIPAPVYPTGCQVIYEPELDMYADDPAMRRVLLSDPEGTATDADILTAFPAILEGKYSRLWEAASAWERKHISGVALSLLTLGVAKGTPKALAIAAWSNKLWNETYYPRKALVRYDTDPDYDFSMVGEMPYSIPELSAEVWGQ